MVFSKFDFGEGTAPTWNLKKATNDPKAALSKMKKIQEKVKTLILLRHILLQFFLKMSFLIYYKFQKL